MFYIDINRSNTHSDPLLGSRWAQMWVHMWVHTLVILLVYVTKGNSKAPQHEFDTFTHMKWLLYKHVTDSGKQFLALVIPKSWKFTVSVEAHGRLDHQGNLCTYCLIKRKYCWKGMNKDIRKYIANCAIPFADDRNTR